jgi:alanine-synthesizing transaminase
MANGASEAITLAIAALVDPGDNIMTPSPGYPLYSGQIPVYHGEQNPYFLNESTGWQIDFDELEKRVNRRTKAIVVINPNNPTGANYSPESITNIVNFARVIIWLSLPMKFTINCFRWTKAYFDRFNGGRRPRDYLWRAQ